LPILGIQEWRVARWITTIRRLLNQSSAFNDWFRRWTIWL